MKNAIVIMLLLLLLSGCTSGLLPNYQRAEKVDCHYTRDGLDWSLACAATGKVAVDENIPLPTP